jgi:SAM-dependent methyltransferase
VEALVQRDEASVAAAIRNDLEHVSAARRLCDWTFEQFSDLVAGDVAEVGAGIGTFSTRILDRGPLSLLLIEPEAGCADALEDRVGSDPRVRIARESLPEAPSLEQASFDLVVCQNVLEHVDRDVESLERMGAALRPGGHLFLIVPAHPRLFGALDRSYGHRRRYDRAGLSALVRDAGLDVAAIRHFNLLGVFGWWAMGRRPGARVSARSMACYDALLSGWRPIESVLRPPWGLSLVVRATRPS